MVNTKKNIVSSNGYDDLYIAMSDVEDKRKHLLIAIKNSLVMQEEYEHIVALRKSKNEVRNEIKKHLNQINSNYQELKKLLPNVKNVISYTENELFELDGHIDSLKRTVRNEKDQIATEKAMRQSLKQGDISDMYPNEKKTPSSKKSTSSAHKEGHKNKKQEKSKLDQELSRLQRIKNNLKVIENKLGDI